MARNTAWIATWKDLAALGLLKSSVSVCALASGFRAVSDDDYARVVIAQRFAEAPALDPSETSWLPAPFWVYGLAFRLFGPTLGVARGTAWILGVLAIFGVYGAARGLGIPRRGALLGAAIASALPYSAYLGIATVPEAPTAGLLLIGCASLGSTRLGLRALGAAALGIACLCRYECWPVALVFSLLTLYDAHRNGQAALYALASLALLPSVLWMAHGLVQHQDAAFFLRRVSEYRRALVSGASSDVERATRLFIMLFTGEPELTVGCALSLFLARVERVALELQRYKRLGLALLALFSCLILGELTGGAPTHHPERTLLALWFSAALLAGDTVVKWASQVSWAARRKALVTGAVGLGFAATVLRPWLSRREPFAQRTAELEIGARAQNHRVERLAILTEDYGYFAVMAGFGAPHRCDVLKTHDPREAPLDGRPADLTLQLSNARASHLILPAHQLHLAGELGEVCERNPGFVLIRLYPPT